MIETQERTNSPTFYWRSTDKGSFSTDMYRCIVNLFSVWYNFCKAFSSEIACGSPHSTWKNIVYYRWSAGNSSGYWLCYGFHCSCQMSGCIVCVVLSSSGRC